VLDAGKVSVGGIVRCEVVDSAGVDLIVRPAQDPSGPAPDGER